MYVSTADGIGVCGVGVNGGVCDDDRERCTPDLDGSQVGREISYRQYPPDLLAFPGGRNSSPTSQASTAPDNTRLPSQLSTPVFGSPSSHYAINFKTLPHNRSTTPYSVGGHPADLRPVLPRHGYVTIPRRPRAPSWSSAPPLSPVELVEPVYDNLGRRTTADGRMSDKDSISSEHNIAPSRIRSLAGTPTSIYGTIPRGTTSGMLINGPFDRSAPEGAPEWPLNVQDEMPVANNHHQAVAQNTLERKVPPRPPPKPKKKSANGPLYEDEGEDGTEV